jgi:hypothetical protein
MKFLDTYPTEFYISDSGYLVFKQECFECGRDTQMLISPEQTRVLLNLLPEMIQQQTERWTGIYNPSNDHEPL